MSDPSKLTPAEKLAEKIADAERRYALDCERLMQDHVVGMGEILDCAAAQQFLIDQAIPLRGLTILSSAPGGTKSWLAYDLTLAVTRGRSWLGRRYALATAGTALVLNYDDPTHEIGRRYKQLGADPAEPVWFHTERETAINLLRMPEHTDDLRKIVDSTRPDLIVINSLRQLHTSDENSSQEMGEVMRNIKSLLQWGSTILVLHHTAKPGGSGSGGGTRGSGEIPAAADAVIELATDRESGQHVATWTKTRGWAMPELNSFVTYAVADTGSGEELRTYVKAT